MALVFLLLSLLCSMLTFVTTWLVLPIFLFCPLALFFAAKCYKHALLRFPNTHLLVKILLCTPMLIALLAVPLGLAFVSQNYRA